MSKYINFWPGDMRDERSFDVEGGAAYVVYDSITEFLNEVGCGRPASVSMETILTCFESGVGVADGLDSYEAFEPVYRNAVMSMLGSGIVVGGILCNRYADLAAEMADGYPEWAERAEAEWEAKAERVEGF